MRLRVLSTAVVAVGLYVDGSLTRLPESHAPTASSRVQPNDNRTPAGSLSHDTLRLQLVVQMAEWRPESDSGPMIEVAAFAEEGKSPQIPAPLIRVPQGTIIVATVRNALADSAIHVTGLDSHPTSRRDSLFLRPGETKAVHFSAGSPGTYLYRAVIGKHSPLVPPENIMAVHERETAGGAFVVDPPGGSPSDRVFVINIWGVPRKDSSYSNALAINGRSWPWTERLDAVVGDTLHWRVVNASNRNHPMHLHGAYFRVDAKGDAFGDTLLAATARRLGVTEWMFAQQTMDISWSPVRAGRWIMHCHIAFHVTPTNSRLEPVPEFGHHDGGASMPEHMAGLVLGINATRKAGSAEVARGTPRVMDLFVQAGPRRGRATQTMSFIVQRGDIAPAPDSISIPGTPLILTRNEPTDVRVHNRLSEATSVHWHGLELESFSDGTAGWGGIGSAMAPSVAPGAVFQARLSMPRAGTFIYHTHMRDVVQLTSGLYGPIVVLEPGRTFDARTDHLEVVGWDGLEGNLLFNGDSVTSPAIEMGAGEAHRLRFVNIGAAGPAIISLSRDTIVAEWRALAKDGADLPAEQARVRKARLFIVAGETYDFEFTPPQAGEYRLWAPTTRDPKGPRWSRRIIVH